MVKTKEKEIRILLNNCLEKVFFTDATKYSKYILKIADKYSNRYGGEYIPQSKMIIIQEDTGDYCYELFFATAIHELSHHICFVKNKNSNHNQEFYDIQKRLLNAAFQLRYLNPYKLALAEEFLSRYSEKNRIKKECLEYINNNKKVKVYQIEFTFFEHKSEGFKYSTICECWYRFAKQNESQEKDRPYLKKEV